MPRVLDQWRTEGTPLDLLHLLPPPFDNEPQSLTMIFSPRWENWVFWALLSRGTDVPGLAMSRMGLLCVRLSGAYHLSSVKRNMSSPVIAVLILDIVQQHLCSPHS